MCLTRCFYGWQFAFHIALLSIFGRDEVFDREDLKQSYYVVEKGYNSMPINLPGTLFNKAMKVSVWRKTRIVCILVFFFVWNY